MNVNILGGCLIFLVTFCVTAGIRLGVEQASLTNENVKVHVSESALHHLVDDWNAFKNEFSKVYHNMKEEIKRFKIFTDNYFHIDKHNADFKNGKQTYSLGLNELSDKTPEELKVLRGYRGDLQSVKGSTYLSLAVPITLPSTIDWRTKGAVTPVKNQGACGSCWTFSTTGSLEGQHFRKTGTLVSLSEEQLVECCHSEGCMGCQGGLMDSAFAYIKKNHGLDTEDSYEYTSGTGQSGTCKFNNMTIGADDTGFVDIPTGSEKHLMEAVATKGPVSVAIDASSSKFMQYKTGVYSDDDCSPIRLDHGVLVVGYGTDIKSGMDYWLVKNSWGPTWGEQGYIKMRRNFENMCGIATKASYPLV